MCLCRTKLLRHSRQAPRRLVGDKDKDRLHHRVKRLCDMAKMMNKFRTMRRRRARLMEVMVLIKFKGRGGWGESKLKAVWLS